MNKIRTHEYVLRKWGERDTEIVRKTIIAEECKLIRNEGVRKLLNNIYLWGKSLMGLPRWH